MKVSDFHRDCGNKWKEAKERTRAQGFITPHDGRTYGVFEAKMNFEERLKRNYREDMYTTGPAEGVHRGRVQDMFERKRRFFAEVETNADLKRTQSVEWLEKAKCSSRRELAQVREETADKERKHRAKSAMARVKLEYEDMKLYVHGAATTRAMQENIAK